MTKAPTLELNEKMYEIEGETAFSFLALAREMESRGRRVISFGIGQPDYPTPSHIREAAKRALDEGFTGYTETAGIPELREAIAEYLNDRYGADVRPDEIVVTTGAKTAVFLALAAYVKPGDEVIIPEPSYYAYAQVVKLFGGRPVFVPMTFEPGYGFKIDISSIEEVVSNKTRAIVLNNPHNPTGSIFTADQVDSLMELARRRNLVIVADEIYDNFVFHGTEFKSVLTYSDWRDYVAYINGFSKTFSMTGWRLGYVVVRREVIPRIIDLAVTVYSCAPSFAQKAAVEALRGDWTPVREMIQEFQERAKILHSILDRAPGIESYLPQGAFYMFPRVSGLLKALGVDADRMVRMLLEDKGVLVLPGRAFPDKAGLEHIRISFATSRENIIEGARLIVEFAEEAMSSQKK
ncbi:MAG: pyridoxal phosphate-dependent aminotransferase [Desulfurococcales archaeon]|nr:pyridoxal phosphate-dependent aminotransferase [Desulfurococcales archaeon]